ncbi:MAG: hypothetical protein LC122_07375 [Chitinophagales bacterium]|nr:hypothetical protein [Chitinophagales bacterium]
MNILFLVAEFAPLNTAGIYRVLKFVKYLPSYGVKPIVVTLPSDEASKIFKISLDTNLLNDVPSTVPIYRISADFKTNESQNKLINYLRFFFRTGTDNIGKAWKKPLLRDIENIIKRHDIEYIFTSLPPFSVGEIARLISKKYHLPLIVDMRDLWSHWGTNPFLSYFHYTFAKYYERKIFKQASLIFCVTPQLISTFQKTHPKIENEKFKLLTNGFDMELLPLSQTQKVNNEKFIIGYTGSFYYSPSISKSNKGIKRIFNFHKLLHYYPRNENWLYRSPYFFLKALSLLFKKEPHLKKRICFALIGNEPIWLNSMISEFGLEENYIYYGFRTSTETKEIQNSFDAFLATSEKVEGEEHYCLPSKLFDYINQNKPIIGFLTEGIQNEFLTLSGLGIICNPDNMDESVSKLEEIVLGKIKISGRNDKYLEKFKRKNITKQFSDYLKSSFVTKN